KYEPAVCILPLGTGNDLSRTLNWGQGYVGDVEIEDILQEIDRSKFIKLDRWEVKIDKNDLKNKINSKDTQIKYMNNYLSIGCDALVTLNFHRERKNLFFPNRIINKLIYFKYGTIDTFLKECRTLTENLELELDGKIIELPHLESIVVLNISHWGGGVEPWGIGKGKSLFPEPRIDDGCLEVFGIYSSFHIAQLQVGLAEPFRIGRAKKIRIKTCKRFPIQIDGEPFEQNSAIFEISLNRQMIGPTMAETLPGIGHKIRVKDDCGHKKYNLSKLNPESSTICLVLRHGLASLTTESSNNRGTDVTSAPVTSKAVGVTTPPATTASKASTSSAAPTTTTLPADNPLLKNINSDVFKLVLNFLPLMMNNAESVAALDRNRNDLFRELDKIDWSVNCSLGEVYMRLLEDEFVRNRNDSVVTEERLKKGARCKRDCNFDRLLNANYTDEKANFTRAILPSMDPTVSPLCRDTIAKFIAPPAEAPITANSIIQYAAGAPLGSVYRPDQLTNVPAGDALQIIQAFQGNLDLISSKTLAVKLDENTPFTSVISVAGLVRPEILKKASPSDLANNIQSFASTVDSSQALVISSTVAKTNNSDDVFNFLKNAGTRFADKISFARLIALSVNISALPDEAIPSTYRHKQLNDALNAGKSLADLDSSTLKLVVTKVSRDEISKIPADKKSDAVINMLTAYSESANSLTSNQRSAFLGGFLESLANLTKQQKIDRFNSLTTAQVEALAEIIVSANSSVYEWLRDSTQFITVINKNSKLSSEKCCSFLYRSRVEYSMEAIKKLVPNPANIRAIHLESLGSCFAALIPVEYLSALADADFKSQ
ncbi:unnamed protein product, partial [Brachionus calyciflorus]